MKGHEGMARSRRPRAFSLIILALSLITAAGCSKEELGRIGQTPQDFTLEELHGRRNVSLSDYRGKNIFIFFWTEGCVFCQTNNIIIVNDIFLKGKMAGLEVFSINIAEPRGDVAEFVQQKGLIFPTLMDKDASVTRRIFGVYVVPTLFIIDTNGVIKDKAYGYLSEQGLWDFVNPYLKGKGS